MTNGPLTYAELASIIATSAGGTVDATTLESVPSTFEELGIDSLGVLGVIAELRHRYGPFEASPATCKTPSDLMAAVNGPLSDGD
jgi:minimal PKS acyl carrier protein